MLRHPTVERFVAGWRRARRLGPRLLLAELGYRIGRAAVSRAWRLRDRACATCLPAVPSGARLRAHAAAPDPRRVAALAPDLADRCARYLSQRFDLLGSGWREVVHGAACDGFDGHRYPPAPIATDPGGAWLAGQVTRPNLAPAREAWRLLDAGYRPIDWHLDFRSGYRWSPLTWYRAVPWGRLPGVDVKVPWELARMQHLPQLALAYGCARAGLPRFLPPGRYRDAFRNQVLDFVATNPPRWGVNWSSTMEVAIRVANWLLAHDLFRGHGAEFDRELEAVFARSVREHARHVARNLDRSPAWRNNHYLAGLAGLAFAAAGLPPDRETRRWRRTAATELARETRRQFLPDGAHFESSTGYHALAAQLVAWAAAMLRAAERADGPAGGRGPASPAEGRTPAPPAEGQGPAAPAGYRADLDHERLGAMAEFLVDVTQPNGRLAQIGDHDGGRLFKLQPIPRVDGAGAPPGPQGPDEEHLAAGPAVAALNGLLGRPDLARWCGARWLDEGLVAGLAGAPRAPAVAPATPAVPPTAPAVPPTAPAVPPATPAVPPTTPAVPPTAPAGVPPAAPAGVPPAALTVMPAPAPARAERAAAYLRPRFPALCRRVRTEAAVESSRVELAAPGASLLTGLRALAYPDFGVYLFRSDRLFLCVRAGLPRGDGTRGHAHVDQLGLEACVDGVGWLRDPGSYAYTSSPRRRNAYRSSAAHFVPYVLDGEAALWRGGPFDLGLEVGVRGVAVGPRGLAVDLVLAGNRLGQIVTIGAAEIVVETRIFEPARAGRLRARLRPGHAGRCAFRGGPARGAVAFSPGYGLEEADGGPGA